MKLSFRALLCGALLASGLPDAVQALCGTGPTASKKGSGTKTIVVNGVSRSYLVSVPTNYVPSKPSPLILSFHGGGKTAASQRDLDQLTDVKFNTDHIVVYPQGLKNDWQGLPSISVDDLGFVSALLDELEGELCIDANRIYATGKSLGGGFVGVLACDAVLSSRIAAFAPVSGAFYVTTADSCLPQTIAIPCYSSAGARGMAPVPMLEFHGGSDGTIPYEGGGRRGACLPAILHWATQWALRNGLAAADASRTLTNAGAVVHEWGAGAAKGIVTHVFDGQNINHDWPSTVENSDNKGGQVASFNATPIIMDFFRGHWLGKTYV